MVAQPHGGTLVDRTLRGRVQQKLLDEILSEKGFISVELDQLQAYDIENIGTGIYTPLQGPVFSGDLESILKNVHTEDGTLWSIPIIVSIPEKVKREILEGDQIVLKYKNSFLAVLEVEEIYRWDKEFFVRKIFGTEDPRHPGVRYYRNLDDYLIGGRIWLLNGIPENSWTVKPEETRKIFKERGWKSIAAFQTRNVPHVGHEFLVKYALNYVNGAFINPVIGKKKRGDWKDEVIKEAWEVLFSNYFQKNTAYLGFLAYVMRYAGPREALHHAIMRKNLGSTHFIVGRDHAGVGKYYKPYEAQKFVKNYEDELGMGILDFSEFYWCSKCNTVVNERICPHKGNYIIRFSGTLIREIISNGETPDIRIFRPEVLEVIKKYRNPFVT